MARQHGYFILIPAFIPVDKKSLQNQIQTGTVIHEAAQTQDLASIMALPGIRYHASKARDGSVKELHSRWGSVEIEAAGESGEENPNPGTEQQIAETEEGPVFTTVEAEQAADEPEQDSVTTNGRRSRAKAA
jgi:hypothetical protein